MKFNFKKILAILAIGVTATATINSNLNVFAQGCPQLISENNQKQDTELVIVTCIEEDRDKNNTTDESINKTQDYKYHFNISSKSLPINEGDILTVETKNLDNGEINKVQTQQTTSSPIDGNYSSTIFEIKNLADGKYDFNIYKDGKYYGKFENVTMKKSDHIIKSEDTLQWFDKAIIRNKNGEKTCDHIEGCISENCDEIDLELIPELEELKELSKKVEGVARQSVLKDYEDVTLIYKDKATNEKVLEKNLKSTVKEIKPINNNSPIIKYKVFKYNLKNNEIPFNKNYSVDVLDKNKNLIGTLDHDLNIQK